MWFPHPSPDAQKVYSMSPRSPPIHERIHAEEGASVAHIFHPAHTGVYGSRQQLSCREFVLVLFRKWWCGKAKVNPFLLPYCYEHGYLAGLFTRERKRRLASPASLKRAWAGMPLLGIYPKILGYRPLVRDLEIIYIKTSKP